MPKDSNRTSVAPDNAAPAPADPAPAPNDPASAPDDPAPAPDDPAPAPDDPAPAPADQSPSDLEWKRGLCGICPAGCWVEVGMRDGLIDSIRADGGHPLGLICRRGEYAPEIIYSENRLSYPMRRTGEKGTYEFERIDWDAAYELIVENLSRIKQESGPEAVAIYTGRGSFELSLCDMFQPRGAAVSSASSVLFPFGSPNTMGVGALCYVSFAMIAPHITMGRMLINMFSDIENADLLVVWGANPATDSPPLDMHRLAAAAARGAEVIVIDPRRTETVLRTGANWIPIRPGTDGALALSMIEVMLEEDLHDEGFAENWCHGFTELESYVQHFRPETVQGITGIPADTIRRMARRVAAANGACPIMYTGLEYSDSGVQAIRAVLILFALAGQLDVPGGIGLAMPDTHFPINRSGNIANPDLDRAVARDRFPIYSDYRGESHASGLVDAVLAGDPYPIRGLIVHGASILTSWPQTPVWRRTLAALDFLVCIDRQLTADAAYADLVLPATTLFEIESYMVYGPLFRLREKLIEPIGEARNDYLIMVELADRLGYGDRFPQSEDEMIRSALEGSGYTLEEIRAAGGTVRMPTPMMDYRKWEKGKLRSDGQPGFETPTGRFEIWSTILDEDGYDPLPKYTEPGEGPLGDPGLAREYPLVFNSGARPQTDFRSQHHGVEGLCRQHPEPTVQLNPVDAESRGIEIGDLVEVRTPRGAIPFRAIVTDDIASGSVECNMGGGTPVGPEPWREWNVNELTDLKRYDPISGFPVYKALLCEVSRLEEGTPADIRTVRDASCERLIRSPDGSVKSVPAPAAAPSPARRVYLDNNATTPLDEAVRKTMLPFLDLQQGNPSSIHQAGKEARDAVEDARRRVARLINARPRSIIFTGGGSESDNLALKGIAFSKRDGRNHIITTRIEHPAVLKAAAFLERSGFDVTCLEPDGQGTIAPDVLADAIREETLLVSIMMANNEVGTIQPIADLCAIAHDRGVLFHTDAVQAAGKILIDVDGLGVDLLSLSAHKFHGPKGIGALFVRKGIELEPLIHGGMQEGGRRAGTHNVPAIMGMGKAAELALEATRDTSGIIELRNRLEQAIRNRIPGAILNGHPVARLPNTLNLTLPGLRGESLVLALDRYGVSISSGSACKSGSPEPTHVLLAMGRSEEEAHCSVRFSLGRSTTGPDIDHVVDSLSLVLEEIENTIRFLPCK